MNHPVRIRRSRKVLFSFLLMTVVFLGLELVSRGWLYCWASPHARRAVALPTDFPELCRFVPHPYSCYRLQPGVQADGVWHNSLGFRGPEISVPKPKDVFRIAVVGGSTTYCEFIADNAKTFPAIMEQALNRLASTQGMQRIEVINAGVPGYNSWESLVDYQFNVVDLQPDLTLVCFGVNDVHCRLVAPSAFRGDNTGRRKSWSEPWEVQIMSHLVSARIMGRWLGVWKPPGIENYTLADSAYKRSRDTGPIMKRVLEQNSAPYFRRNVITLSATAAAHGSQVVLVTWPFSGKVGDYVSLPHYRQGVADLNRDLRELAMQLRIPMFDLATKMPDDPKYWRDGRHVNEKGAELEGLMLAQFLMESRLINQPKNQFGLPPTLLGN
jgi:lysophospholipase L1-like esterase